MRWTFSSTIRNHFQHFRLIFTFSGAQNSATVPKAIWVLYITGKEIFRSFRIWSQIFFSNYRFRVPAPSLNITFRPKIGPMTSLWRHDWQWNHIFHIDLWSTQWGRPPVQILAQSEHFLQFYSDFSVENQHFFQKMTKWRHDDVINKAKIRKVKNSHPQHCSLSISRMTMQKTVFEKLFAMKRR